MTRPLTKNYRSYTITTKAKTKDIPFSNTANQVEQGVWEWQTSGFKWQYHEVTHQINLRIWSVDHWVGVVMVRDHREAGCFAEGFAAGYEAATAGAISQMPKE